MKTSYIDLYEKEKKEKEEELNTTAIDNMQAAELEAAGVDPTLASHKGGNFYTGPSSDPKPAATGVPVTDEKNYYEDYISQLDESLVDPINTKKRQEDLAKAAQINATGGMLQNVIDLIAGGGSNGAPIYKRTDTATPAMLNQLERLRADDARRQEIYNAQKLQNQIRGISFGQQDKDRDKRSEQYYYGEHKRTEERKEDKAFTAEQNRLGREAQIKAQEVATKGNTEAQKELIALRTKYSKELDDYQTANAIKQYEGQYGAQMGFLVAKAALEAKQNGPNGTGTGDDKNFYIRDDETGEIVTIPPADYWNIVQKVVTSQGTYDGEDFTMNEDFKLNESQLNALVAKHWKEYPPPTAPPPAATGTTDQNTISFATDAGILRDQIIGDQNLPTVEAKRQRYGIYIDQMAKAKGITLTPEQREAMLQTIQ